MRPPREFFIVGVVGLGLMIFGFLGSVVTATFAPTPMPTPTAVPPTSTPRSSVIERTATTTIEERDVTLTPTFTPKTTSTPRPTNTSRPTATRTKAPMPTRTPAPVIIAPTSPPPVVVAPPAGNCDPSYPGICIPPPPPDLDCPDIPYRRFTVLPPDPHRFDADHDGIGCESG